MTLTFEDWNEIHGEEALIAFAESGADRELDFDEERALEALYEVHVETFTSGTIECHVSTLKGRTPL